MPLTRPRRLALATLCLMAGCAGPPTKELSQAEGAIEAARAAGAAKYAVAELAAAEEAMTRARAAVAERDHRSALSHALDGSARAKTAAAAAGDGRVKARLAADQALDDFASLIERVDAGLAAPEAKRVPAGARRRAADAVAEALEALRSARAAVERGDLTDLPALSARTDALQAALASLAPPGRKPVPPAKKAGGR